MTFTHALSTNNYGCAKFIVDASAANGTHTTISSALTSASSGETIFIRPGTYTENPTLKAGVNLCAYVCDSSLNITGHVIINGTCSMTTAGTVTISGIQLQTNSAALLSVTGSAASVVELVNCYLNMSNNTGITFSSSSASASIRIETSRGDLGTTGIAIFSHSSAGTLAITRSIFSNSGASSTASTCSAGSVSSIDSFYGNPMTFSGTGRITAKFSEIDSSATNSTSLTTVSGTSNDLQYVRLSSGTATPLSVGGTVTMAGATLHHTNATGITGAGTLLYSGGGVWQTSTVGAVSVTTLTPKFILGALNSTAPAAGYIGEQIRAQLATGSATTLVTATPKTVTSISVTPGIWDISSLGGFSGATTATQCISAIGTTTNSLAGTVPGDSSVFFPTTGFTNSDLILGIPSFRVSLSATTTYYLIAQCSFTVGTGTAYGRISATRVA